MEPEHYVIKDIEALVNAARNLVFNNFGQEETNDGVDDLINLDSQDQDELDNILSYSESLLIVQQIAKKQRNTKTNEIRYILTDELFYKIIHALNDRMVSNLLNDLVNKGLIESAFDEKSNDFVFWVKDTNK